LPRHGGPSLWLLVSGGWLAAQRRLSHRRGLRSVGNGPGRSTSFAKRT